MRLIDGDALLQEIEESANAVEIQIHLGKCNKDVAKGMLSGLALVRENVLRKPTAYDPEKVVEEVKNMHLPLASQTIRIVKCIRKGGAT